MDTVRRAWRKNIRELYESFERTDAELELLREIDRAIIDRLDPTRPVEDRSDSIEEVFLHGLRSLAEMYGLPEPGRCYVYLDDELVPLRGKEALRPKGLRRIERFAEDSEARLEIISKADDGEATLFAQFPGAETILLQPLYDGDRLLAVLVFADTECEENSVLSDELAGSVTTVSRQLSIAYDHFMRAEQEERTHKLWNLFLNSDLGPSKCFKELVKMARHAYPRFGPLRLETEPEVQILVVERTDEDEPHFMTIRGTTGDERVIEKIDIERSISGLLVLDPSRAYFCDDPRKEEYRPIYKSYLGNGDGKEIKSEFAIPLNLDGQVIGVLNLESEIEGAFNLHHRAAIGEFAERITPMVEAFEERIVHNRVMHLSGGAVTDRYLESLASIFRHGVATPLAAFSGDLENVKEILEAPPESQLDGPAVDHLEHVVRELEEVHVQIEEFTTEFAAEIGGFGVLGKFDLQKLVQETVDLARRSLLRTTEARIEIVLHSHPGAFAFCSPLLKQHFFSVLTNAIYSQREKAEIEPSGPREITVTIKRYDGTDPSREVNLNRRWVVQVLDDGVGVDPETLEKLRRFEPESHFRQGAPGMGLGLVALQRYMASIGGWVELKSARGDFFEVQLLFDEYLDEVHGPLSTLTLKEGAVADGK